MNKNTEVHWIKITTRMFDDEKIKLIESMPAGDTILIIWIKLLCLAGKCNNNGYIYLSNTIGYTPEMLSTLFNRELTTIKLALKTFIEFEMIEILENNGIEVVNWGKHQNIDKLLQIKENNRERQRNYREKNREKVTQSNVTVTLQSQLHNAHSLILDTDKDIDIEEDNNIYASSLESSQQEPTIRKFQTNKNNEYFELKESLYEDYKRLYPNVDLDSELNLIEAWLISNPTRRKTKKGFPKFLNNWLSNSQNKNRSNYATNTRNNKELSDYEKRRQFNFEDVERSLAERRQSSAFSTIFSQSD